MQVKFKRTNLIKKVIIFLFFRDFVLLLGKVRACISRHLCAQKYWLQGSGKSDTAGVLLVRLKSCGTQALRLAALQHYLLISS
jgi:hypothetical protein